MRYCELFVRSFFLHDNVIDKRCSPLLIVRINKLIILRTFGINCKFVNF